MNTHRLSQLQTTLPRRLASTATRFSFKLGVIAALATLSIGSAACIEDTDCGICDPDNLILESISGINYQSDRIHILNPACEGENCPAPLASGSYFVDEIIPCEETEAAQESPNAAEYCRLSPLVTAFGIEFIFNNLLDPTSIELVRKQPDNPQLFEVYDWKTDVLQVQGPITRFNGDYNRGGGENADTISRLVNLSCIDNLRANGEEFSNEDYENAATNPCNAINPTTGLPMKLFEGGTVKAARGIWTANDNDCTTPQQGPDTCCSYCDFLLSTKVERYGADESGTPRNPNEGVEGRRDEDGQTIAYTSALDCYDAATAEASDLPPDQYAVCTKFFPSVDRRDEEQRWQYEWCAPGTLGPDCALEVQTFRVPLFDKLRETHPDRRPAGMENLTARCTTTRQCTSAEGANLEGTECMGTRMVDGVPRACNPEAYTDGRCTDGVCRPLWMGSCSANQDTTGDTWYCQDRRFSAQGTSACLSTTNGAELTDCDELGERCQSRPSGSDLAFADWDENNLLTADEACQGSLFGPAQAGQNGFECDPFYQGNLREAPRYDRNENLPAQTQGCICPTESTFAEYEDNVTGTDLEPCIETVNAGCYDGNGDLVDGRSGQYAVKFVTREGGIIYDPAVKGFEWLPADIGSIPRADVEACAEDLRDPLPRLNRHDGWRAADTRSVATIENFEDFDRALCSGQEYTIVFNEPGNPDNPAFVVDKADNTLEGKSVYRFTTSQFHVQPESGFPPNNLRIGACDEFSLRFSNKYDASPENVEKLQIYRVTCEGDGPDRVCTPAAPDPRCDDPAPPEGACCEIAPVAGGSSCVGTEAELTAELEGGNVCAAPCLTVDIGNQLFGEVTVEIDATEFGQVLNVAETYRLLAPTAGTLELGLQEDNYADVFWDACGMPLVAENAVGYDYDFTIDTPKCKEDEDGDGIPISCDNAPTEFNPNQFDIDRDGFGDAIDLCPTVPGSNNSGDSDRDGIGNDCDACRQTTDFYNNAAGDAAVPDYMMVRNNPDQTDTDEDGIGDVCDNCIAVANCQDYGPDNPYEVGGPISDDDDDVCQQDSNRTMVGDACEDGGVGLQVNDYAAGPIGFADTDDFDQDGIANVMDDCPRQPVADGAPISCTPETAESDCGPFRACSNGVCNHVDSDDDGVGNACDTCPFIGNPDQIREGFAQEDDPDGDFVGEACEVGAFNGCGIRPNARRFGFYEIQSLGNCCTTQLVQADEATVEAATNDENPDNDNLVVGDLLIAGTCVDPTNLATCQPLTAPHPEFPNARDENGDIITKIPVRTQAFCSIEAEEDSLCRILPPALDDTIEGVSPRGILLPPPGCDVELEAEGTTALDNLLSPLTEQDFATEANPLDALWQNLCFLPQLDQDYDGLADECDLCPNAFDPDDTKLIDDNGRLRPNRGAFCFGDFLIDEICAVEEAQSGEGDTDDGADETSGGEMGESGTGG